MSHWIVGKMYKDHKRNKVCILHAMSPYKEKSGQYLDFKYLDGKYIRQSAAKALSRFEKYDDMQSTIETEQAVGTGFADRMFAALSTDGGLFHTPSKATKAKKSKASKSETIDWTNVIRVDFVNKCRIA